MAYYLKLNKYEKLVKSDKFYTHNDELYVVYGLETVLDSEFIETGSPKFHYSGYNNNIVEKRIIGKMKYKMHSEPVFMIRHKDGAIKIRRKYEELVYKDTGNMFTTTFTEIATEPSLFAVEVDWQKMESTRDV